MKCARTLCPNEVTEPGLWLVPVTPPGPWVDACSADCAKHQYDHAVSENRKLIPGGFRVPLPDARDAA